MDAHWVDLLIQQVEQGQKANADISLTSTALLELVPNPDGCLTPSLAPQGQEGFEPVNDAELSWPQPQVQAA